MSGQQISYAKRDFASLRTEQINLIRTYYPDVISNFNDASIMSVLLDLNAGIADNLHYYIDKALNETFLDTAQQTASLYKIAKTLGFKLPTRSASVAVCEFTAVVPVFGDAEDKRYLPILKAGTQVTGDGQIFELAYDIDFAANTNMSGFLDRTKIPVYSGNVLSAYQITKTGVVINGQTKVYQESFGDTVTPFYQVVLPESNVLSIDSVIHKNGTNLSGIPGYDEFATATTNKWYEVMALAQDKVFVPDPNLPPSSDGLKRGFYKTVPQRFIKEFTPLGYCQLTFGNATDNSFDILDDFIDGKTLDLRSFINNSSLGQAPMRNTTMYVKYRVGGGVDSNVGMGVINDFGVQYVVVNGPDSSINQSVKGSLLVTNITPAVGGSDLPSIDQVRNYIAYNFASQQRAVTLRDYETIALTMPSQFGSPARVSATQNQNKIELNILSLDANGNFDNMASSVMMQNLADFLAEYRMINDYVVVKPAEIVDLGFEVSALVEDGAQVNAAANILKVITDAFASANMQMGQSFYLGTILRAVANVNGVLHVNYVKVFNKVGGGYSTNTIKQTVMDSSTGEVDISSGVLLADKNQILQVRNPDTDIVVIPVVSNPRRLA